MNLFKFLLYTLVLCAFGLDAERLPDFSYDYKALSLQCGMMQSEPVVFPITRTEKSENKRFEKTDHSDPKPASSEPIIIKGESDIRESTPIQGLAPKFIYRYERFIKSRFYGKLYANKHHFFYLGGFKAASWRADPRDMGVYAGSGMDF